MNAYTSQTDRSAGFQALSLVLCLALSLVACPVSRAAVDGESAHGNSGPVTPFLTGADLSELPYQESRGAQYFDGGKPGDLLAIARQNHWNVIRVRLWVNPDPRPALRVSSLDSVTALGKRIKAKGLTFMLDIHYSRF